MSDILNARTVPLYAALIQRHVDGSVPQGVVANVLVVADRFDLLRDPAEPTLAEIRKQVEVSKSDSQTAFAIDGSAYYRGRKDALAEVLALLEPKKPGPRYVVEVDYGTPRVRDTSFSGAVYLDPAKVAELLNRAEPLDLDRHVANGDCK